MYNLKIDSMKILRNILTVVLFTTFLASCSPTSITEDDSPNLLEQATGGNDTTEIDNDRD